MKKILIALIILSVSLVSSCGYWANKRYNEAKKKVDEMNEKISLITPDYQDVESLKSDLNKLKREYGELGSEKVYSPSELVDEAYDENYDTRQVALTKVMVYVHTVEGGREAFLTEAMPILLERLKDNDTEVRKITVRILKFVPMISIEVIPELIEALDDVYTKEI